MKKSFHPSDSVAEGMRFRISGFDASVCQNGKNP